MRKWGIGINWSHREESVIIESAIPLKSPAMTDNQMISSKSEIKESYSLSVVQQNLDALESTRAITVGSVDHNVHEHSVKSRAQSAEMKEDADEDNVAVIEPNQPITKNVSLNTAEYINRLTKGYTNVKVINHKSTIFGVTAMNDKIYVVGLSVNQPQLIVYSSINLERLPDINIPHLRCPEGFASCSYNNALYISDDELIRKINLTDNSVDTWRLMYESQGLSVTSEHNVLVTVWYRGGEGGSRVLEYMSDGQMIRAINLSKSIMWAKQALELSHDLFIICHGLFPSLNGVSVISPGGVIMTSFGNGSGRGEGQLDVPLSITMDRKREVVFVADTGNGRIVMLDYNLTYLGFIHSREDVAPTCIYFDSSSDLLIVGGRGFESLLVFPFNSDGE